MFSDPQSVTINAVPYSMPRTETSGKKTVYSASDGNHTLTISHTPSKDRVRSMWRLDERAVVADPLTSVNDYENCGIYLVIDRPIYGFSMTRIEQIIAGIKTALDNTAIDKLFGQES